jgi:hypothetical protein
MPVYNGAAYLKEAIESILSQTFTDFEFIIVNDGSTDNSEEIILSYSDKRIVYKKNNENIGLIATLNHALSMCKGEFIARMDCDDISTLNRLYVQVNYLSQNLSLGIVGSWFYQFSDHKKRLVKLPTASIEIKAALLFRSVLAHPTVMFRNALVRKGVLQYSSQYLHAEDFGLWAEMSDITDISNIAEPLLNYRMHDKQVSVMQSVQKEQSVKKIQQQQISKLHIQASEADLEHHFHLANGFGVCSLDQLTAVAKWIEKLHMANAIVHLYDKETLIEVTEQHMLKLLGNSGLKWKGVSFAMKHKLFQSAHIDMQTRMRVILKLLIGYKH